jgi:hypothetical protein
VAFTAYDDYGFIPPPRNVLNDDKMVPDAGSVNPILVGAKVNAPTATTPRGCGPTRNPCRGDCIT